MDKTATKTPPKYAILVDGQIQNYLLQILKDRVNGGIEIEELRSALDAYESIISVIEVHNQEPIEKTEE